MKLHDRPKHIVENAVGAERDAPPSEAHGLYRVGLAYGRFVHRARWVILAIWIVALAASIPFAGRLSSVLSGGGYSYSGSESIKVSHILVDTLGQPQAQLQVVFQSADTPVRESDYQSQIVSFTDHVTSLPHVTGVQLSGVGNDGKSTVVTVNFDQGEEGVQAQLPALRALLAQNPGPAKTYIAGGPAVYQDFTEITNRENERAEATALPIALVVLIIVFGTFVAALMPLMLALVAVPVALAIIYAIAMHNQTSIFVLSVASIIGLGISIDYSLFMVRRFREELAQRGSVRDAVGWTVATAGEAILFSGLTVIIGFIGMLLIGIQFMTSMGIGGAIVVAVSVTAALTLLPAILGILGHRINALRIPLLGRFVARAGADGTERAGFWHAWALTVMKRPVLVVVGVSVLLIALGWPIFSLRVGTPDAASLPGFAESRQGWDILNAQFPAASDNTVVVVVRAPDGSSVLTDANLRKIDAYTQWLTEQPNVSGVVSLTQFPSGPQGAPLPKEQLYALYSTGAYQQIPALSQLVAGMSRGDTALITVQSRAAVNSADAHAQINHLRAHREQAQGLAPQVGGFQAVTQDFNDFLYGNFPKAIIFILAATYVLLLLMFRSVLLPLKAIVMNVLSVAAAYGVLVFVFQFGALDTLGFHGQGYLDSTIPILLFCILFGLSMDYEVFLLSRIREEWLHTKDNRYAVARGLEKTGGVITNAALLFVIVAGAFSFTSIIITQEMGIGMTVAVLVDAAIIRTLLVPATMRLLGRWNWWLPSVRLTTSRAVR